MEYAQQFFFCKPLVDALHHKFIPLLLYPLSFVIYQVKQIDFPAARLYFVLLRKLPDGLSDSFMRKLLGNLFFYNRGKYIFKRPVIGYQYNQPIFAEECIHYL